MKNLFSIFMVMMVCMTFIACSQEGKADASTAAGDAVTATTDAVKNVAGDAANAVKKATDPVVDPDQPTTTVKFDSEVLELGEMQQGEKGNGKFVFTNTGSEPLIISNAKGSCGCTVPEWPKTPIAPGETGEIAIEFNSKGKKGKQTKTVTIQANTDPNPTRLTVKANVLVPEGTGDSAN